MVHRLIVALIILLAILQYRLYQVHFTIEEYKSNTDFNIGHETQNVPNRLHRDGVHPFCSKVFGNDDKQPSSSSTTTTARYLWSRYLDPILYEASIHPYDERQRIHYEWTRKLLDMLSSPHNQRFEAAVRTIPHHYPSLERIYSLLEMRLGYIIQQRSEIVHGKTTTTSKQNPPPPLKILVFGGSIVEGIGCDEWSRKDLKVTKNSTSRVAAGASEQTKTLRPCSWPFRLESFVNKVVHQLIDGSKLPGRMELPPLVQVHNLAVGGTNSDAALPVLRYWLTGDSSVFEPYGADIVINAYSANDNLPPAFHATKNTTVDHFHAKRVYKRNQDFIDAAIAYAQSPGAARSGVSSLGNPCEDFKQHGQNQQEFSTENYRTYPIVLYVDDYIGNQQESIVGEGTLQEVMTLLIHEFQYLGLLGYVSPANMVRAYVLANTSETVLSPKWVDKRGEYAINVHFGLSTHVYIAWTVAYALLKMTLDFCDDDHNIWILQQRRQQQSRCASSSNFPLSQEEQRQRHKLRNLLGRVTSVQATPPSVSEASLSTISEWWRQSNAESLEMKKQEICSDGSSPGHTAATSSHNPCVFAFLAAPLGTHQQEAKLHQYLQQYMIHSTGGVIGGWQSKNNFRHGGFQNKLGFVATKPNATVTFAFQHIAKPVRVLTIHYLKSYGPNWDDSVAKFTLEVFYKQRKTYTKEFELEGFHAQNTSISYGFRLDLTQDSEEQFYAEKKGAAAAAASSSTASTAHNSDKEVAPIGSSIRLRLDLVSGKNFKINAMMVCSR